MRHGVETILLAIAAAARQRRSEVIRSLAELGVKVPKVPELGEVLSGQATLADRRDVSVADVLGREVVAAERSLLAIAVREYRPAEAVHDLVWRRSLEADARPGAASADRHLRAVPPPAGCAP